MVDAVVVGSGPNGLAAAVTLARAGLEVRVLERASSPGGGTRTAELTEPGVLHDVCSSVHPLGAASPFLATVPGIEWVHPPTPLAHPLDGERVVLLHRSLADTAAGVDPDGSAWRRSVGRLAEDWESVAGLALSPPLRAIRRPLAGARFGIRALRSAKAAAGRFEGGEGRALIAGLAAHAIAPLDRAATAGVGLVLGAAGHAVGWPFAAGGSQTIADSMVAELEAHGGALETGVEVSHEADIPEARLIVLDTSPGGAAEILGLEGTQGRRYRRFRHGPGTFKVDLTLDGPVPWSADAARSAGTVHLGGTFEEIAAAEAAVASGDHPERPFVLLAQPSVADDTRAPAGIHVVWAYCHVPAGSSRDMTEPILSQIERFAPGTRDLIRHLATRGPADFEADNPNYVGGDIAGGAVSLRHLFARPRAIRPYRIGDRKYLCSASTPPGPGAHGMCGFLAAKAALQDLGIGN